MPVNQIQIRDPEGGGNQSGLRDQNARLVLSYIRRHGAMPSAEIARRSGLSAQTVSNIIRALEAEDLLCRGLAIKGKVGKPSVPMALNPQGVLSLGLSIGRRAAELVLVDFNGIQIDARTTTYAYPTIEGVFSFLSGSLDAIFAEAPERRALVSGIGVSRPNAIWEWLEIVSAPQNAMQRWQDLDLAQEVARVAGVDAFIENDATAGCVSEHLLGRGNTLTDFAYIFVGAFVGGGLVLGGKVMPGKTHNAAALGPLPVPDGKGGVQQLLNVASLHLLDRAMRAQGQDPENLRINADDWTAFEDVVGPWIEETGYHLAIAAASIASVVEVESILIDGAIPSRVRERLVTCTRENFERLDITLLSPPEIEAATVGRSARSVGAALLPILSRYFVT